LAGLRRGAGLPDGRRKAATLADLYLIPSSARTAKGLSTEIATARPPFHVQGLEVSCSRFEEIGIFRQLGD
jgi:hypothetical protein